MPEYKFSVIRADYLEKEPKKKTEIEEDFKDVEELFRECGLTELLEDEDG